VHLQVQDMDSARLMIHVQQAKGLKDRSTNYYKR
jgi:hypothetical protein